MAASRPCGFLCDVPEQLSAVQTAGRLAYSRDFFWRAGIFLGRGTGCDQGRTAPCSAAAMRSRAQAMLARNPFLDFLVGDALAGWFLLPGLMAQLARVSSIIFANSHFSFRLGFDTAHWSAAGCTQYR